MEATGLLAVYGVIAVLVTASVLLLRFGLAGAARRNQRENDRFAALNREDPGSDDVRALRKRSSRTDRWKVLRALNTLLVQSGTGMTLTRFAVLMIGLWIVLFLIAGLLPAPLLRLPGSGMAAGLSLVLFLRIKRARRMARFGEQLPDVLDVIVRSLRAGHPLPVSLGLVARETPDPAGREFAVVVGEISYGRSVVEALEALRDRVGYPELRFFVAATSIAHQTGGNMGEILSRLSRMLRERFRLARRSRALSAEGRFSGIALSLLPIVLFGLINLVSRGYYQEFWASSWANTILFVSLGLLVAGNLAIFRLVNFRV